MESFELDADRLHEINRAAYNRMARLEHVLATPATDDELRRPLEIVDEAGWLGGNIRGWNVLCLAAGGGRHSALYQAAGANVTVVDVSDGMLELDREVCNKRGIDVRLIQGSMTHMPMLRDEEFDLVVHPVSTCYVFEIAAVFREVSRVLRAGGLYVSQHKNPISLQASLQTSQGRYTIESEVGHQAKPVSIQSPSPLREPNTIEIAHSLEAILGGICRSGMSIEDIIEPDHANGSASIDSMGHRCRFIPPYLRVKARKHASQRKLLL